MSVEILTWVYHPESPRTGSQENGELLSSLKLLRGPPTLISSLHYPVAILENRIGSTEFQISWRHHREPSLGTALWAFCAPALRLKWRKRSFTSIQMVHTHTHVTRASERFRWHELVQNVQQMFACLFGTHRFPSPAEPASVGSDSASLAVTCSHRIVFHGWAQPKKGGDLPFESIVKQQKSTATHQCKRKQIRKHTFNSRC